MKARIRFLAAGFENLGANPLRTGLSTLGVVIGVASLVAILALADGMEAYTRQQIVRTTDLQTIVVSPRTSERRDGILIPREEVFDVSRSEAATLQRVLGATADVTLSLTGSGRLRTSAAEERGVLLTATLPQAVSQLPEGLAAGRFLSPGDVAGNVRVAVATVTVADWVGTAPVELPGARVSVDGAEWRIVGVMAGDDRGAARLIVPLGDSMRAALERPDRRAQVVVRATRVEEVDAVRERVEGWLNERYGDATAFVVASNRSRTEQARQGMLIFKLVMGAIAGISLLVGGIGIMNILLASVVERTREIGIRKAAGARARDIRLQFLTESVAIAGAGSVLGVMVGLAGAFGITAVIRRVAEAPLHAGFSWASILVAASAALLVGLVFGTYPARRAARLSPIEAIRHE